MFLQKITELYNTINLPIDSRYKMVAIKKYKKLLNMNEESFSKFYIKLKEKKKLKEKGVVYTPDEIANYIVKSTLLKEDIINNPYIKILDPSCGCGDILISCYKFLYNIYKDNLKEINYKNNLNITKEGIAKHIIENNLYGFDIDIVALMIFSIELFEISNYFISDNFKKKDFLMDENETKYDIIIGNPPYIGHKTIAKDYSKKLKIKYENVYKDKGDISYCFFQKGITSLNKKGKLAFITSRYFMESPSGEELRKVLKEICSIYKIVDFYGIRPFKMVGIDPVIIFLSKEQKEEGNIEIIRPLQDKGYNKKKFYESLFLNKGKGYKKFFVNKNLLNNKGWLLIDDKERNIIYKIEKKSFTNLYNICDSYQGIITGCDKAFIVDKKTIIEENLEDNIIRPWIKSSHINDKNIDFKDMYIIYSDEIQDIKKYPNIIAHIENQKKRLIQRRECKKGMRKWYELQWGRKREIFEQKKIIFPYKSNNNRFIIDKGNYFSADIYALVLKKNVPFTYEYITSILNSSVYQFYFQSFAKKLGGDLYEYYPNNIMKLCIPIMFQKEIYSEDDLNKFFKFSEEEINIIHSCTKKDI